MLVLLVWTGVQAAEIGILLNFMVMWDWEIVMVVKMFLLVSVIDFMLMMILVVDGDGDWNRNRDRDWDGTWDRNLVGLTGGDDDVSCLFGHIFATTRNHLND